jgi:predicted TIM-barrel fold metal-dependent hydrolase
VPATDRYVVFSADTHGGTPAAGYRDYLDPEYREEFDAWLPAFDRAVHGYREAMDTRLRSRGQTEESIEAFHQNMLLGLTDGQTRLKFLETDGCVGGVVFAATDIDTLPPFNGIAVMGDVGDAFDREHVWAGTTAYNRWLADFCAADSGRLAGVAVLPDVDDVDHAVEFVEWAAGAGLRGGVALPANNRVDQVPYDDPCYDRFWAACVDRGMVLNIHVGVARGDPKLYGSGPRAAAMMTAESEFWARRPLSQLVFGGAFDRYPKLRLAFSEMHADWIPPLIQQLEAAALKVRNFAVEAPELSPREYWARNCAVGATFMTRHEALIRDEIGVETIMYGTDFPHPEGTYPHTLECIRNTLHDVPPNEVRGILGENAARFYGLDLDELQTIADEVGPRVDEVLPLGERPEGFRQWAVAIGVEHL